MNKPHKPHISILTPYGKKQIVYADCTGSGNNDPLIDMFITKHIMPLYANVHSDSFCSDIMSALIEMSRNVIKSACLYDVSKYALIFTGNGMTGAARHLAFILNSNVIAILYTTFEHVSNSTLWESCFPKASVYMSSSAPNDNTVIDINDLRKTLKHMISSTSKKGIMIVAFTACSNVLGRIQPVNELSDVIKEYREYALRKGIHIISIVDCAACAPYIPLKSIINENDAILFSPHKFKGGNSTPGVLILKKYLLCNKIPFFPGGGTVWYKSNPENNYFLQDCEQREEGGTPNIIGIIRTGLLFIRKVTQQEYILKRIHEIVSYVDSFFLNIKSKHKIHFYTSIGKYQFERLPIYAFHVKGIHPGLFVKVLSDEYGIQARSGVSCCYLLAEKLCDVSNKDRKYIFEGHGTPNKYGWIRVTFHYTQSNKEIDYILKCIEILGNTIHKYIHYYEHKCTDNKWYHKTNDVTKTYVPKFVNNIFNEMVLISSL